MSEEKRIKLTKKQFDDAWVSFRIVKKEAIDVATALIIKIIERKTREEETMWDSLAHLAGFEGTIGLLKAKKTLKINWLTGEIVIRDMDKNEIKNRIGEE